MNNYCTYLFIATAIISILISLPIYKNTFFTKILLDYKSNIQNFSPIVKLIVFSCIFLVFISLLSPWILSRKDYFGWFNFDAETGYVGDTIGGIMNPIVALVAVVVTGLAFYTQLLANKQVSEQFKLQQFESQFYEMLKLHRNNIEEMEIEGYEYIKKDVQNNESTLQVKHREVKTTSGRKIFVTMTTELEAIFLIVKKVYSENVNELDFKNNFLEIPNNESKKYFFLAYEVFFHGLDKFERTTYQDFDYNFIRALILELRSQQKFHKEGGSKTTNNYITNNLTIIQQHNNIKNNSANSITELRLHFNYKPFSGHQSRLGHYFRHLITTVNFVVKNINLKYEDKREYLKILRSQFSNHEFVLLYYNYLSSYGSKWENDKNSFLIDYRMIHNIQKELVISDFNPIEEFIELKSDFIYKNDEAKDDQLFELYDSVSTLDVDSNRIQKQSSF